MSMQALLGAARDTLQSVLSLTTTHCDVQHEGRPPMFSGQYYVALWQRDNQSLDTNAVSLDETYDLDVIVTYRTDVLPPDRLGSNLYLGSPAVSPDATPIQCLNTILQAIKTGLHMNYNVLLLAGGVPYTTAHGGGGQPYSIGDLANGFVEPLKFSHMSTPATVGPEWFGAEGSDMAITGVKTIINFVGARRAQQLEIMS